jgi:lysine-specific demethylase/histidyl-hydroxylase NO66
MTDAALGRCTSVPAPDFAARYWGRRPALDRGAGRTYSDLLSAAAVDELVSRRGLRTPFLRMAKDGSVIAPARFTRSGGAGAAAPDQVADDRVLDLMADGATLVLQGLHRTWPPLIDFGSQLADELGHPVQINAYVTPPQNQGFAAHYDVHDVFVLQVVGTKRWHVHEPVLSDPLADQPWEQRKDEVSRQAAGEPLIDAVLEPGDSLYLPRGYLHSAVAQGELSIHLTVGVHGVHRFQLARHLLSAAQADPHLRATLPMGVDLGDPTVLAPHVHSVVAALHQFLDSVDPATIATMIAGDLARQTRPAALGPLAQLQAQSQLTAASPLRLRPALRLTVTHDQSHSVIAMPDKQVTLPVVAEAALKVALSGLEFSPADLPGLEPDEQLVIARRLLREGIVLPL